MRIDPTNTFHIARAYGVTIASPAQPAARIAPQAQQGQMGQSSRLVAGTVPGGIDFGDHDAQPTSSAAIPMYRHPADKNAAATTIQAGRLIDLRG